jgi:hypothetical protein
MKAKRFPANVLAAIREEKIIGIRAGMGAHRVIGIWAVVVEGRVFVRSWSRKPQGWHQTFLDEPLGLIQVGKRKLRIRAVQTRSERLKDLVSKAYLGKYNTPGSIKYVQDMARSKSRNTTTELIPLG